MASSELVVDVDLRVKGDAAATAPAQRLSDERIREILYNSGDPDGLIAFARLVEAAVCPPGHAIVPMEPTERMGNCGFRAGAKSSFAADMIYRAMIAAAQRA